MNEKLLLHWELASLQDDYAAAIDDDRLEDWPTFFVDDCLYEIIPRENEKLGLTAPVIYCDNAAMLRDRVVSLRNANIYSHQCYKHFLSAIRIVDQDPKRVKFTSNYLVINTDIEGQSSIYQTGVYQDTVVKVDGMWKFKVKRVVYDTSKVKTLLAYPI